MANAVRNLCLLVPKFTCLVRSPRLLTLSSYNTSNLLTARQFTKDVPKLKKETVTIYFVFPDGKKTPAKANVGDNLLDVVIENDVDIDGYGACEGTLACSTCHVIFSQENYDAIQEKHTDEELDMLDLAYDLCDTSRLGCQVIVNKQMDGWEVKVPSSVADARES